ncbi:predicted protein [Sclerotinia sclerotiorum 1980 UF-70]|uniref:Uncharacterized protein n=1 Tax=Sclerotinia sclerotiorum (strain ATCC 18683 / 1980 / Ss-1) TaxID=665079 RepID=A7E7H0_SCLS1|nr:predicted protein [Sclerotinia sclerotiorum 1980 UF-70]EDN96322.1 predicted protein [Sclerotinia sclerotiorum 1980 UF-70]
MCDFHSITNFGKRTPIYVGNFKVYRSRSFTSNSTNSEPSVKRRLSSSSSGESLQQEDTLHHS